MIACQAFFMYAMPEAVSNIEADPRFFYINNQIGKMLYYNMNIGNFT